MLLYCSNNSNTQSLSTTCHSNSLHLKNNQAKPASLSQQIPPPPDPPSTGSRPAELLTPSTMFVSIHSQCEIIFRLLLIFRVFFFYLFVDHHRITSVVSVSAKGQTIFPIKHFNCNSLGYWSDKFIQVRCFSWLKALKIGKDNNSMNKKSKHKLRKGILRTDSLLLNREDVTLLLIAANQEQTLW